MSGLEAQRSAFGAACSGHWVLAVAIADEDRFSITYVRFMSPDAAISSHCCYCDHDYEDNADKNDDHDELLLLLLLPIFVLLRFIFAKVRATLVMMTTSPYARRHSIY